ncbi:MAG: hypothetical protein U5N86_05070 [Planctomycetota bacterium]|nr:hypothetical protein [Planctomycetota bacterium]
MANGDRNNHFNDYLEYGPDGSAHQVDPIAAFSTTRRGKVGRLPGSAYDPTLPYTPPEFEPGHEPPVKPMDDVLPRPGRHHAEERRFIPTVEPEPASDSMDGEPSKEDILDRPIDPIEPPGPDQGPMIPSADIPGSFPEDDIMGIPGSGSSPTRSIEEGFVGIPTAKKNGDALSEIPFNPGKAVLFSDKDYNRPREQPNSFVLRDRSMHFLRYRGNTHTVYYTVTLLEIEIVLDCIVDGALKTIEIGMKEPYDKPRVFESSDRDSDRAESATDENGLLRPDLVHLPLSGDKYFDLDIGIRREDDETEIGFGDASIGARMRKNINKFSNKNAHIDEIVNASYVYKWYVCYYQSYPGADKEDSLRYVDSFQLWYDVIDDYKRVNEPIPKVKGKSERQLQKVPEATTSDKERMREALKPYKEPQKEDEDEEDNKAKRKATTRVPVLTRGEATSSVLEGDETAWDF